LSSEERDEARPITLYTRGVPHAVEEVSGVLEKEADNAGIETFNYDKHIISCLKSKTE
jgi:hypothetical protein